MTAEEALVYLLWLKWRRPRLQAAAIYDLRNTSEFISRPLLRHLCLLRYQH